MDIQKLIEPKYGRHKNSEPINKLAKHDTIPNEILELL